MSQLVESIMLKDGWFHNLLSHEERMNNARKAVFNCNDELELEDVLDESLAEYKKGKKESELKGKIKCRILYQENIESIEFEPYKPRTIKSLKVITDDTISYKYKTANRTCLNELFEQRGSCDDIIIVKNGFVTDSSAANILFFDGKRWVTPSTPLLKGTQRQLLLNLETITSKLIRPEDIQSFQKVRLVNAMLEFEDEVDVMVKDVVL